MLPLIAGARGRPPTSTQRIQKLIAASGAEVAVVMRTLDGRRELFTIDPDKTFHAASTMKVPIMIELFRQADAGTLKLDDQLPVRNEFHSIVDGSVYQLSVGDDSDADVYKAVGKTMTLRRSLRSDDHGQLEFRRQPADRTARRERTCVDDRRIAWARMAWSCCAASRIRKRSTRG